MHKKLVYKTPIYKIENYIKIDNKYGFNEFDTSIVKKFKKNRINAGFDKKLNGLEAKVFQSTY